MHNDLGKYQQLTQFSSDKFSSSPETPAFDTDFWLQSPGVWQERRNDSPLLLLTLSKAIAILSVRAIDGRLVRVPIANEKIWLIPAGTPFAAHWHAHAQVVCLKLKPNEMFSAETRVIRLVDVTRDDWRLTRMVAGWRTGKPGSYAEAQSRAVDLARHAAIVLKASGKHFSEKWLSTERFRQAGDFIEEHLNKKLSREVLASAVGQSLHHFTRMFKRRTGLTLREYISRRRCFRARELIESGERLSRAAVAVGFADQAEMCKKFNQVFGSTPGKFARQNFNSRPVQCAAPVGREFVECPVLWTGKN
jgi:AraC-like DNA-binding protein